MKKYLMLFGAGILVVLVGVFSKIRQFPGADIVLITGLLLELVSFIMLARIVFTRKVKKP